MTSLAVKVGRTTVDRVDPASPVGIQPDGQSSGWSLTDSEEFATGTMTVMDAANGIVRFRPGGPRWRTWYPDWQMFYDDSAAGPHSNTNYDSYYTTAKVQPGAGFLTLKCDLETTLAGWDYTAGMIATEPSRSFQYGFFEVQMRITGGGPGVWPAFWTTSSQTNTWNSEIDIIEAFDLTNYKSNVYIDSNGGSNGDGVWTEANLVLPSQASLHTYGCRRLPTGTTFYRDGVQVATTPNVPSEQHYLILNNGAYRPTNPSFATSSLIVEYVRVWAVS